MISIRTEKILKCVYGPFGSIILQPDPLIEALESVVGDYSLLDGQLQVSEVESQVFYLTLLIIA